MKILVDSNAPWAATGYGVQGASLARRLRDAGHTVAYYCNYGLHGGIIEWEGIRCLPGAKDGYDDPIVQSHIRTFQPDLVITIFDIWVWADGGFPMPREWQPDDVPQVRWAAWVPIDHDPLSPANRKALEKITYPIAMSAHGQKQMRDAGVESVLIPHGVEKDFGFTSAGRREFRRYLQIPDDAMLYGSVGLNRHYPGRKGFDRLIEAFSKVEDKGSYLYLHTLPDSQVGSLDLRHIAEFYGVADRVKYADTYNYVMGYSQNGMNSMYSAIDCYVQSTHGEGFGVPVAEAQACGCPVIATDCTSMPELVSPNTSILVPPATHYMVPDIGHRYLIDVPKLTEAMNEIATIFHTDRRGYESMRANAGIWANNWDWDTIWRDYWVPFLADVEEDVRKSPKKKWYRGGARLFDNDGAFRKQDSRSASPAVKKELDLLLMLDHPNIVPVLGHGSEDGLTYFDMPKYQALDEIDPRSLTGAEKQRILDGLRAALKYLHNRGVAHRDVHPSNILLDEERNPYLIDFAWAHPCDGDPCVDFEPWLCMDKAVPSMQLGADSRGFHTVVQYLNSIDLSQKTHGYKGVPYQQIDGSGERDCQPRWDLMKPDVKGKSVIDLGCNLGWFLRKALDGGAERVVGVENDRAVADAAAAMMPDGGWKMHAADLEEWDSDERFDVAFCLSVLQHLRKPDRLLKWMVEHVDTIYIEIPSRFITDYMASILKDADMLGESERGRPVFRVKSKVVA